ncbi:MAG: hypothetical protein C4526_08520 [Nitrospiraceae bacterium]|nr:MAG: hypothetical protein C4526_08520 [Nitrospiraceae bacterium]
MNRNLKIFLATGVPFGIFASILFSSLYGTDAGLPGGLISGLIFGFLMFIILGFLHSRAVGKIAGEKSGESMGTCQVREIQLPLPYDRTFDLCIDSLKLIRRCRVREEDRSQGKIVARSAINWKTWGDTVSFDITGISSGITAVKVTSRPTSRSTIVDYGKNLENVKTIISFLEKS